MPSSSAAFGTSPGPAVRLTLLVRAYCHLCDEMRSALAIHAAGVAVEELDVDADPVLEARWGALVPVLLAEGRELCHYRLDTNALSAMVARGGGGQLAMETKIG